MRKPSDIKILVACEESQEITKAFRERGFTAFSCDIEPCSGGHPEWHIQGDVFSSVDLSAYDLIIAHPPCTHLCVSGARWFNNPVRPDKPRLQQEAIEFFMRFTRLDCPHVAIENPIGIMSTRYRKPDQIVQPYFFGDHARKSTCWWLKGLPKLVADDLVDQGDSFYWGDGSKRQPKWYREAWNLPPKERAKARSKTFPGMARAIAKQWGDYLLNESPVVIVQISFHFLHRDSIVTRFKTYRCCVKDAIKRHINTSPELWDCTDYSYLLTDEDGRIIK